MIGFRSPNLEKGTSRRSIAVTQIILDEPPIYHDQPKNSDKKKQEVTQEKETIDLFETNTHNYKCQNEMIRVGLGIV